MAKFIEFSGSPGVGKSTIYSEIEKRWGKHCNWIPAERLLPEEAFKSKNIGGALVNFAKLVKTGKRSLDIRRLNEAGKRFIEHYPDFMEACWRNIVKQNKSFNGLDLRFERSDYLRKVIQKVQITSEAQTERISLVDEGVMHLVPMALYKSNTPDEEKEEILSILESIPLPAALVYVEIDIEENVKRLLSRNKVVDIYKNLNTEQLSILTEQDKSRRSFIASALVDKGIPVLRVNSKNDIESNVASILSFVEAIN